MEVALCRSVADEYLPSEMGPDASAAVDRLVELCKEQSDYNTFDGRHAFHLDVVRSPLVCSQGLFCYYISLSFCLPRINATQTGTPFKVTGDNNPSRCVDQSTGAKRVITIRCTRSRGPRGFWKQ